MSNAQKAQDFVTSFMKNLAEGVELTQSLQAVFAKILAEQVVVDADTNVVSFKPVFSTLLKVLTFIATPEADRPEAGSSYTQDAIDTAAGIAATETGLTVGEEIPTEAPTEEPTDGPTDEPTEEPTDGPTDEPTEEPGVEGKTLELTTGADVFAPLAEGEEAVEGVLNTTENNDTITGDLTSRSSTTTFGLNDKIDGGEGFDTLKLNIDKEFRGYSETEVGIQNIERLELTNIGNRKRKFDAKNIEDLEEIALYMGNAENAEIQIAGLADVNATIEAHNLAKGSLKLDYATDAVSTANPDDTLNLVLNNVGRAQKGKLGDKNYESKETVDLAATGLGQLNHLNISSLGNLNQFDVGAVGIDSITLTGAATTELSNVSTQLNVFDASAATGTVVADLSKAATQNLKEITGGAGDDTIRVSAEGLATTVKLDGGAGDNTLNVVVTADKTIKPTMENFQTLGVTGGKKLTVSGEDINGLEAVSYDMGATGELLLANLANTELTLNLGKTAAGKATYTGEGLLTINTAKGNANPTDATGALIPGTVAPSNANIVASEADTVELNVQGYSKYTGTVTAAKAAEVTLTVESALHNDKVTTVDLAGNSIAGTEGTEFAGTLQANEAEVVNINAQGKLSGTVTASKAQELNLNVAAHGNTLVLAASEAQALSLTVEGDKAFTIASTIAGGTANLNKVEELQVTTSGQASIGVNMNKLASATFAGTGSFAAGAPGAAAVTGTSAVTVIKLDALDLEQVAGSYSVSTGLTGTAYDAALLALAGDSTPITAADIAGVLELAEEVASVAVSGTDITVTFVANVTGTNTAPALVISESVTSSASTTPTGTDLVDGTAGSAAGPFKAVDLGGEAQDVGLDATDLLGDFTVQVVGFTDEDSKAASKAANGTADIFGSGVGVNTIIVNDRNSVEITGGVQDDVITVKGASWNADGTAIGGVATAVVTGGLGADVFTFTASSVGHKLLATITDFEVGVDVFTDAADVSFTTRAEAVTALTDTFKVATSINDAAVITEIAIDLDGVGTGAAVKGFAYDGDVYVFNNDAGVLVQLTGLSEADYTVAATNSFALA